MDLLSMRIETLIPYPSIISNVNSYNTLRSIDDHLWERQLVNVTGTGIPAGFTQV